MSPGRATGPLYRAEARLPLPLKQGQGAWGVVARCSGSQGKATLGEEGGGGVGDGQLGTWSRMEGKGLLGGGEIVCGPSPRSWSPESRVGEMVWAATLTGSYPPRGGRGHPLAGMRARGGRRDGGRGGRLGRHGGVAERGSEHYLIPHQVAPPSPFRVTCPSCLGPREWVGAVSVT